MIHFRKLRLQGFKSFVEKTELDIESGLTGIVGPNGCGKSNLVEALRWVMGESSARKIRGGEMDDVIFAGTSNRPARSLAEVSLVLDNAERSAPAAYNAGDEIEILRKIVRDQGSDYRINGRPVRARDVQLLFADTVAGANSPAIVSQGKVTAVINAKPADRRLILEESAGVSGLYARRHEAEIRLRAAETNLSRLEDLLGGMETRLNDLKKQARQATRYRNVSTQIRQMELAFAWLEWSLLHEKISESKAAHARIDSAVAESLGIVTRLTVDQTAQADSIPPLRHAEAEAAAILQTRKIALQRLDDEENRIASLLKESLDGLARTEADRIHEATILTESAGALARLEEEEKSLLAQESRGDLDLVEKQAAYEKWEENTAALESRFSTLTSEAADMKARRAALESQISRETARRTEALTRARNAAAQLEKAQNDLAADTEGYESLEADIAALDARLAQTRQTQESDIAALETARRESEEKRAISRDADHEKSRLTSEIETLRAVLELDAQKDFRSIMEDIDVDSGFEIALSRALGDTLLAATDPNAPSFWTQRTTTPQLPALPDGAPSLLSFAKAPPPLHAALSQIGVVETDADGARLFQSLQVGQSLVSRDGYLWRWDGLHIRAAAADRHANHLRQKKRLQECLAALPDLADRAEKAANALGESISRSDTLATRIQETRKALSTLESDLSTRRARQGRSFEVRARLNADIARLSEAVSLAAQESERIDAALNEGREALSHFDNGTFTQAQERVDTLRIELAQARDALREATRTFDLARAAQSTRRARLQAIGDERVNTRNREIRARERLKTLAERATEFQEKFDSLKDRPETLRADRDSLLSALSESEAARTQAANALAEAEKALAETSRALKSAENLLSAQREDRAREQATVAALAQRLDEMVQAVSDKFALAPADLLPHLSIEPDQIRADGLESVRARLDKLVRERDGMGPVNLRADVETQEIETEKSRLVSERDDLVQAIAELRGGIGRLNREARERLNAAFESVNGHFQTLFRQLFGEEGAAHLALIDSDDPLEAGLEIFAQPPGKTLQSLSLLSGGEQTLTSIALIFAMFLTNPAPICVLDEIDAPLDDANVDRVCDLLDHIAERSRTRFLVITHHRLTMARMDRLYGVTMAERGVSQLVSVDLQKSFEFIDSVAA